MTTRLFFVSIATLAGAFAQPYALMPIPKYLALDNNGRPCVSCKIYTYQAGTSTPLATYQSQNGAANTNPIILNARGEANIWLGDTSPYKITLKSPSDVEIWTVDNVSNLGELLRRDLANTTDPTKGAALVGFKQPLSGAVGRTVYAKLQETVSILDFGAVCDGSTNDTLAFTRAGAIPGLGVRIPANKTCMMGGGVTFNGAQLIGENRDSSIVKLIPSSNVTMFTLTNGAGISNVTINGNNTVQTGTSPMIIGSGLGWFIQNSNLQNASGYAISGISTTNSANITNNYISGSARAGITLHGDGIDGVIISQNRIDMTGIPTSGTFDADGVQIKSEGGNAVIQNITLSGNSVFMGNDDSSFCFEAWRAGASTDRLYNITISGNNCDVATIALGGISYLAENGTISGNNIKSDDAAGDVQLGIEVASGGDVAITGNTVRSVYKGTATKYGMSLDKMQEANVTGNVLIGAFDYGIRLYADTQYTPMVSRNNMISNNFIRLLKDSSIGIYQLCNADGADCNNNSYIANHIKAEATGTVGWQVFQFGTSTNENISLVSNFFQDTYTAMNNANSVEGVLTLNNIFLGVTTNFGGSWPDSTRIEPQAKFDDSRTAFGTKLIASNLTNPNVLAINPENFATEQQGGCLSVNSKLIGFPNWEKTSDGAYNRAMFFCLGAGRFTVGFGNATNSGGATPYDQLGFYVRDDGGPTTRSVTFSQLPLPNQAAGTFVYCEDCTVASPPTPCSGGGTGSWVFVTSGGLNVCPF